LSHNGHARLGSHQLSLLLRVDQSSAPWLLGQDVPSNPSAPLPYPHIAFNVPHSRLADSALRLCRQTANAIGFQRSLAANTTLTSRFDIFGHQSVLPCGATLCWVALPILWRDWFRLFPQPCRTSCDIRRHCGRNHCRFVPCGPQSARFRVRPLGVRSGLARAFRDRRALGRSPGHFAAFHAHFADDA
jgi:hypothetical protein